MVPREAQSADADLHSRGVARCGTSDQSLRSPEGQPAGQALPYGDGMLRAVMGGNPIPQFVIDPEHRVICWNKALEALSGISAQEVMGTTEEWRAFYDSDTPSLADLLLDGNIGALAEWYKDAARLPGMLNEAYHATAFLSRRGKAGAWLHLTAAVIRDSQGRVLGAVETVEDVTERRQAQERIAEQAALLDVVQEAIAVLDLEGRVRYWNRAAERLSGWTAEEMCAGRINPEIYRDCADRVAEAAREVRAVGAWSGEMTVHVKDERRRLVQASLTLVRDAEGRGKAILLVVSDITEHRRLESQLLRAQRVECVGQLANGVAHDLNNVLSPILMCSEVLLQDVTAPEPREMIDAIRRSAQRGSDIVKQLLMYSRGSEGKHEEMDLRDVVRDGVRIMEQTFPKTIQILSRLAGDLWRITGDVTQVHQVLLNLCVNARDAMPDGGTLTLSGENLELDEHSAKLHLNAHPGLYVVLSVSDTGAGMSPEIQERLFDPFFTTKAAGQGTGLGLFTVLGIVKSHGGFVHVESRVGEGSEFKIYLPAKADAQRRVPDRAAPPVASGAGELILVVDDEEAVRRSARMLLESHRYRVLEAGDGFEALGLCSRRKEEIRAFVVDMWMPFMDGAVLLRELRKMCPEIPVLVVSGLPELRAEAESASASVKAFLPKPYNATVLLTTLRKVLDEQKGRP